MLTKENCKELSLREGSMRTPSTVHNGGWYSTSGVKIGWGDLGPADFKRVQSKLQPGEMMVVLGEKDSFWNFVTQIGIIGAMSKVTPDEQNPGQPYIAKYARWIIANDMIYLVDQHVSDYDYGFVYKNIARGEAEKLIVAGL